MKFVSIGWFFIFESSAKLWQFAPYLPTVKSFMKFEKLASITYLLKGMIIWHIANLIITSAIQENYCPNSFTERSTSLMIEEYIIFINFPCHRMTLLLGPPGCGKTSFLKALSGILSKSLKVLCLLYALELLCQTALDLKAILTACMAYK